MRRAGRLGLLLWALAWPFAAAAAGSPIEIYAVNYPLAYLAERIGGERVRVELPVPRDVDPAFWRPPVETIGAYQRAGLTAADDGLPERLLKTAHKSGPSEGVTVDLAAMLPDYYRERGWSEDGVPSPEKLGELGLSSL